MPVYKRVSDKVLEALELAIGQKDPDLSDALARCLEMALSRGAGGKDFTERRHIEDRVQKALEDAYALQQQK